MIQTRIIIWNKKVELTTLDNLHCWNSSTTKHYICLFTGLTQFAMRLEMTESSTKGSCVTAILTTPRLTTMYNRQPWDIFDRSQQAVAFRAAVIRISYEQDLNFTMEPYICSLFCRCFEDTHKIHDKFSFWIMDLHATLEISEKKAESEDLLIQQSLTNVNSDLANSLPVNQKLHNETIYYKKWCLHHYISLCR